MNRNVATVVFAMAALVVLVYSGVRLVAKQRARAAREQVRREFTEAQCCREIVCDACGERSGGVVLNRGQVGRFLECPMCGELAGRPIVYRFCQNPDCNRRLVEGANTVILENGEISVGDDFVCTDCGSSQDVYRDILRLNEAERIAEQTGQQF